MTSLRSSLLMAIKAVWHGRAANLLSALAMASVLAPLLILYGLKAGIINGMVADLKSDPEILRINISGYKPLTDRDIAAIRALPMTGFAVGSPRSIASRVEMSRDDGGLESVVSIWFPTAMGDPLLPAGLAAPDVDAIVLSRALADELGVATGERVRASIFRNDQSEIYDFNLTVTAILPASRLSGLKALVSVERLNRVSAFSDNYAVPEAGGSGLPLSGRTANYDSLRLYARSLETVEALESMVAKTYGFRTASQAANIAWVRELDIVMSGLFAVIAAGGIAGFVISFWAMVATAIEQNRPNIAMLRLLGMPAQQLWVFPLTQVLVVVVPGIMLASVIAFCSAFVMNRLFLVDVFDGQICSISAGDIAVAMLGSLALGMIVMIYQFRLLLKVSPSEALAEGGN